MFNLNNVEVLWDSTVEEINGSDFVECVTVKNKLTQETKKVDVNGVFIAVGHTPNIDFLDRCLELIDGSWIKTNEYLETNVPRVYAAGDIRDTHLRQIVMAVSDGALAVSSLLKYL